MSGPTVELPSLAEISAHQWRDQASVVAITTSVGKGGQNKEKDVKVVQRLLKHHMQGKYAKANAKIKRKIAAVDPGPDNGKCTPKTIASIRAFQSRFYKNPDGRVDPGGTTWNHLISHYSLPAIGLKGNPSATDLARLLLTRDGQKYVLGVHVPKRDAHWFGPWDCAEFVVWGLYQVTGKKVAWMKAGDLDDETYTGQLMTDLPKFGVKADFDEAKRTAGIVAVRTGSPGHTYVTRGGGQTIEAANASKGVCSRNVRGKDSYTFFKLDKIMTYHKDSFVAK